VKKDQIIISNTTMEKIYSKGFDFVRISVDSNNSIKSLKTLIVVIRFYIRTQKKVNSHIRWHFFVILDFINAE
jgi:hypothetical protein